MWYRMICKVCRKSIVGKYLLYGWQEIPVCDSCNNHFIKCDICGLPVNELQKMHDGRDICKSCLESGIAHMEELRPIYQKAQEFVDHIINLKVNHKVNLNIVNARTMGKLLNEEFYPTVDYDPRESGICIIKRSSTSLNSDIYIESFHNPEDTMGTCIHEYGHAIFAEHRKHRFFTHEENEGFSRWLEYEYLQEIGNLKKAKYLTNDDSVYGWGLRLMLSYGDPKNISKILFD